MNRTETLSFRLVLQLVTVVVVVTLITNVYVFRQVRQDTEKMFARALAGTMSTIKKLTDVYNTELQFEAARLSSVFKELFPADAQFGISATATEFVGNQRVPALTINGQSLAGDYRQVDQFAAATGGNATIFVRSGDDFVRVVTSVKKQDGSRAVGTLLDRQSPAYRTVMKGESFFGKMTLFGRRYVTDYTPIMNAHGDIVALRYIGVAFADTLAAMREGIAGERMGRTGFLAVVDSTPGERFGELVVHPTQLSKKLQYLGGNAQALLNKMRLQAEGQMEIEDVTGFPGGRWLISWQRSEGLGWYIMAAVPHREISASANKMVRTLVVAGVLMVLLLVLTIWLILRHQVALPLTKVVSDIQQLAAGDYTSAIAHSQRGEIGAVQQALVAMQRSVGGMLSEVELISDQLFTASEKLTDSSNQVALSSQEQAQSSSSMAATIEELTVSIEQLSGHAREASDMSEQANQQALEGSEVITKADQEMHNIANSVNTSASKIEQLGQLSVEITSIIQVIETIADQTNLLALNAAIEAARAGAQGRGFAVVAEEVRNLAARTTESAHEITSMIEKVRNNTQQAVQMMEGNQADVGQVAELANAAGASIQQISAGSQRVVQVIADISNGLKEQAMASTEAARNVERIVERTHVNNEAVNNLAQASEQLKCQAAALRDGLARFTIHHRQRFEEL